jgi:hypothetical protein
MLCQPEAMRIHLQELVSLYGEQVLVNLLNQKGHEKPVKDAYEHNVEQVCHEPFSDPSSHPAVEVAQCSVRIL